MDKKPDTPICCLYATAPFTQADDLDKSHSILQSSNEKTVIFAATSFAFPVQRAIRINDNFSFPSKWALIPVLGALLIIAGGSGAQLNRIFLMNPLAVWFGLISYPLYLWHWPILSFLQIVEGEVPQRDARVLAVLLSIFLAWFTYRFVERPMRFGRRQGVKSVVLIGLITMLGSLGFFIKSKTCFKRASISR